MLRLKVPATSANLGCAFDCAAIALSLHLEVTVEVRDTPGVELHYVGPQPDQVASGPSNLLVRAVLAAADRAGAAPPHLLVRVKSQIPIAVGLGSSAAAIVAGILIGATLGGALPSDDELLALAASLDGHPDNVAAALLGGFAVAAEGSGSILTRRTDIPDDICFIVAIPGHGMTTSAARSVLPENYTRVDAVHNLQRTALLVAAAFAGDFRFRPEFFQDRFHQPQRAGLMPGTADCLALEHPALMGVVLSGSGSSVLAISRDSSAEIAGLLQSCFRRAGLPADTMILAADNLGARRRISGDLIP